jgi:lysophospholipase L1-like esterase
MRVVARPVRTPDVARIALALALAWCLAAVRPDLFAQGARPGEHWVGTWATAVVARAPIPPQGPPVQQPPQIQTPANGVPGAAPSGQVLPAQGPNAQAPQPPLNFNNQTLRQIVHISIGGDRVRVVLTNAFGSAPLAIGAARVAIRDKEARIVPGSARVLMFSGNPSMMIPPGAVVLSDPVDLRVAPLADLAIDIHLPGDTAAGTSPLTIHNGAFQTSYVSPDGDHTGAVEMPVMRTTQSWFFLARVEVAAPPQVAAVATFGDSITDGTRSTPDANSRWPDQLARRLAMQNFRMGVLNLGIAGNRILSDGAGVNALARFDRDALVQPGVTHVIVLESINDIGMARQNPSPTVADLIAGHLQIVQRAHSRGLKTYVSTLTPFEGANYWTPEGEAKRKALNEWIRANKVYDGVIDFDAVLRDPGNPTRFLPQYDSGDHLHPNDAGYQAMGNAVNLELLKASPAPARTAGGG